MKLKNERLIIRTYRETDLDDACQFLLNEKTMHYIPERFKDKDAVLNFIRKQKHYYPVVLKEKNKVIGHLYFEAFFGKHSYEIGWVFNEDYTGSGYAYESSQALLDYGFKEMHVHRVIATAQPENKASWTIMEKLRMRREGEFKACIPHEDTWWDEVYYAILKEEWLSYE